MNLKTFITVVTAFTIFSINAKAQKYGATPEDSLECVRNLSVYGDFINQKDYLGAYPYWVVPFTICPKSSLKMYVDGDKMLQKLIKANKDNDVRKKGLIDTLLMNYDQRIVNFGKEGFVLGRKGAAMYKYKTPSVDSAFTTLNKSIMLQENKSEAAAVYYYFAAAVYLQKKGKKEKSEVVDLFTKCSDILSYNIKNQEKESKKKGYQKALNNLEAKAEPYLSCEAIQGIAEKNFEENKDNKEWVGKMATLLKKKKCTESAIYFTIANRRHELDPSAESASGMGILAKNKKKFSEAVEFFKQAIEMIGDTDNEKKADYEFLLARTYYDQKQYSAARQHCREAIKLRPGWGEPYILIGDMYAASLGLTEGKDKELKTVYWVAVDKYIQAKGADASVATQANKKIASYSQHFPEKQAAFFHTLTEGNEYTVGYWINEKTKVRVK